MKLLLLAICLTYFNHAVAVEVFLRAGDAPQAGEIYRVKETGQFVDAATLPHAYRSRITRNEEVFEKVDMTEVIEGRAVSSTGVVTYKILWHARSNEELLHDTENGVYIVLDTIPDGERAAFLENARFKKIVPVVWEEMMVDKGQVEKNVISTLDKVLGIKSENGVLALHSELSIPYSKYLDDRNKAQSKVLSYIGGELSKQTKRGNIDEVEKWQLYKNGFISGDLFIDDVKVAALKKKIMSADKSILKAHKSLIKKVKGTMSSLVKSGRVAEASVLKKWISENGSKATETKPLTPEQEYQNIRSKEYTVYAKNSNNGAGKVGKGQKFIVVIYPGDTWKGNVNGSPVNPMRGFSAVAGDHPHMCLMVQVGRKIMRVNKGEEYDGGGNIVLYANDTGLSDNVGDVRIKIKVIK